MKSCKLIIIALSSVALGVHAQNDVAKEAPVSEAVQAIKAGLVKKPGDATELTQVKEDAVKKIETLAAQGKDVKEALDYLDSRIGFDPRKEAQNKERLKAARDRIEKAVKLRSATGAA